MLTSEIVERDGHPSLRLDYNGTGVDIRMPADHETVSIAASEMVDKLAGVSRHQIIMAALKTISAA